MAIDDGLVTVRKRRCRATLCSVPLGSKVQVEAGSAPNRQLKACAALKPVPAFDLRSQIA